MKSFSWGEGRGSVAPPLPPPKKTGAAGFFPPAAPSRVSIKEIDYFKGLPP